MTQYCRLCAKPFLIGSDELSLLGRMSFDYPGYTAELPPPENCPDCRLKLRTSHRNEQHLYHALSPLSGKKMISLYDPEGPRAKAFKVYTQDEWHGDGWDGLQYGRDFDFSRPFFVQFAELQREVPRLGLVTLNNENSPYTTGTAYCKNCHLINCSEYCENCYYGKLLQSSRDCLDCSYAYESELCYECFSVRKCYGSVFLSYSNNCSECYFSENLTGCKNCLFCTNLQRAEFCVLNQQVSREDYAAKLSAILGSHSEFMKARSTWHNVRCARVHKYANITNSEDCTGDFISNSKKCVECYDINDCEDCRYVCVGVNVKDMLDCSNVYLKQELNYQILGSIGIYHSAFCIYAFHCHEVLYCDHVFDSRELFGCAGLKRKQHCILNRQYSKDEYHALAPRIIEHMKQTGEWGRFFPPACSPYSYNESLAFEYLPLNEEQALSEGFTWRKDTLKENEPRPVFMPPDHIFNVPDDICAQLLRCEISSREFKVMPQELRFYRAHRIPIPRRAPLQRHYDREALRNKRRVWERFCESCGGMVSTNFDPAKPEVVYCEDCFSRAVY